jgi:hypothetical protein
MAVGGFFGIRIRVNYQLTGFREVFVTSILPENDLKLVEHSFFYEMIKGEIGKYLNMRLSHNGRTRLNLMSCPLPMENEEAL